MSRQDFVRQYLFSLVLKWEELEAERQEFLAAATRITAIQAEKAELLTDAQDALTKYNQVFGTSYTLQQVRAWYNASMRTIIQPPPQVEVPNVVGMTQLDAQSALTAIGLSSSVTTSESTEVAEGLVIDSTPVAGTSVPVNTTVVLNVSAGPPVTP